MAEGDLAKVVLCGDRWAAQEKLADNITVRLPRGQPLQASAAALSKALGVPSLDGLECLKGKGKPPNVTPGARLSLDRSPADIAADKALVILYFRSADAAAPASPQAAEQVKLLLCGDKWPAKERVTDMPLVKVQRQEAMSVCTGKIAKALGLASLAGVEVCRGKGKPPDVKPGPIVDLEKTPDLLGFGTVQVLYVRSQEAKPPAAPPKAAPAAAAPAAAPAAPAAPSAASAAPVAAGRRSPPASPRRHRDPTSPERHTVRLESAEEQLGLEFHAIGGKVFIDGCKPALPFCRAKLPTSGVLVSLDGAPVSDQASLVSAIGAMRGRLREQAKGPYEFAVETDRSHASQFWVGSPVEMQIDREWLAGTIRGINGDGTFDVHLTEDDEVERNVDPSELRLRDQRIQEAAEQARRQQQELLAVPAPHGGRRPSGASADAGAPSPHPPPGQPRYEGHMKKQGADIMGLYKQRRFALYDTPALYYFHPHKVKPLGVIDLRGASVIVDPRSRDAFDLAGPYVTRTFRLQCSDGESCRMWTEQLRAVGCQQRERRGSRAVGD